MKITIYTITNCPFCKAEKDYLTSKNLIYVEKNVETDRVALGEMMELSDHFAGVPFTTITPDSGDMIKIKGFTKEEFDVALTAVGVMSAPVSAKPPVVAPVFVPQVSPAPIAGSSAGLTPTPAVEPKPTPPSVTAPSNPPSASIPVPNEPVSVPKPPTSPAAVPTPPEPQAPVPSPKSEPSKVEDLSVKVDESLKGVLDSLKGQVQTSAPVSTPSPVGTAVTAVEAVSKPTPATPAPLNQTHDLPQIPDFPQT